MPDATEPILKDEDLDVLGFQAHFGRKYPPAKAKITAVANACVESVGRPEDDGLSEEERRHEGDFEVRVARKLIDADGHDSSLGVESCRGGEVVTITYIDVERARHEKGA